MGSSLVAGMGTPPMKRPYVVGLTGGIANGKSTVAQYFQALGVPWVSADRIGKRLTEPGSPYLKAITEHFGKAILHPDGTLDRSRLRTLIFNQMLEKKWLENLLHPAIESNMLEEIKKIKAPYCLAEIPLLVETGKPLFVDRVLVIDVIEPTQVARLQQRDGIALSTAKHWLTQQSSRATRLQQADDILSNEGSLAALKKQVKILHQKYCQLADKHRQ